MKTRAGIADYEFIRTLGSGTSGEFFLAGTPARLRLPEEHVAVKVHLGATNEETYRRAIDELRTLAGVRSPHLVQLIEAGHERDELYYVCEYLALGSLASPARPVGRTEVLAAIADAARGAHALHEAGVAHQAVKPSNVLLTDGGGKLGDPGLATIINPGQTTSGVGPTSAVEFLDPAIIRGDGATRWSDIYSLGTTIHRALTGVGIYGELPDQDPLAVLRTVLSAEPSVSETLSPALADLVRRCVAPDPADRPATADEVATQLDQLAGDDQA